MKNLMRSKVMKNLMRLLGRKKTWEDERKCVECQ